jgi:hypothetical protein
MILSEIRTLVRKKLGETTGAFWTDAEINGYINLGCKDIAYRTKCLKSNTTFNVASCVTNTAVAGSNEFTISSTISNFFAITEAVFMQDGTSWEKLTATSREELDTVSQGWRTAVGYTYTTGGTVNYNYGSTPGTPMQYYWDREEDVLGIYPPADDDNDGAYLKVYYTYNHTDLSLDSSSPTLPVPLHPAVVEFAVATGMETRGWGDRANDAWQKYFAKLNDYTVEKKREREDEEIISKNYRNL